MHNPPKILHNPSRNDMGLWSFPSTGKFPIYSILSWFSPVESVPESVPVGRKKSLWCLIYFLPYYQRHSLMIFKTEFFILRLLLLDVLVVDIDILYLSVSICAVFTAACSGGEMAKTLPFVDTCIYHTVNVGNVNTHGQD
jgi:hypothetical protein